MASDSQAVPCGGDVEMITEARASISQDYWEDIKEDWGSRGRKSPSKVQGQSPGRGSGGRSPPEA